MEVAVAVAVVHLLEGSSRDAVADASGDCAAGSSGGSVVVEVHPLKAAVAGSSGAAVAVDGTWDQHWVVSWHWRLLLQGQHIEDCGMMHYNLEAVFLDHIDACVAVGLDTACVTADLDTACADHIAVVVAVAVAWGP